jgi:hypothetical protein
MSESWSEERLHAMVDGELSSAEAAELLERMAADRALREQVSQIRLAKELVRHAYAGVDVPGETPRPQAGLRRGLVVAGLALFSAGLSFGWWARDGAAGAGSRPISSPAVAQGMALEGHVVLHLSEAGPGRALAVLERAEGLIEATRGSGKHAAVEIVANGPGLDLLRATTSPHATRIEALRARHPALTLVACGQTLQKLRESGADVRLLPGTQTASSALDQIVTRLQQGWAYVRI